ncbi:MAG: MerR family transcriptional regulator [Alphaproteobacteria bacterium]|nr:MerR family transcriptional regulator [Alphaproteobacteria bacterium]MCB9792011.1 MerR family transcriptional regulator [Alphaproteobacteria bacterium]
MATSPGDSTMRIGALAKRAGKTSRAIHFYEELGLLRPAGRTKGGFRLYGEEAVTRIRWIERLQELGFSLPEIQEFLARLQEEDHGPDAMRRLEAFYREKLAETRAAIARLAELERDLSDSLDYLAGCRGCEPLTHRSRCSVCDEAAHEGRETPVMVAAVHSPHP